MKKEWTGERLETFIYNQNTIEHLHRYAIAMQLAENKIVLDIASGEGYGSNLLASVAKEVIGVDISPQAIEDAKNKYRRPNLEFVEGTTSNIPCEASSVDLVVSFETIEHHSQHEEMMEEIKRVLKPTGVLVISSPDKQFYSVIPNYANPFHVKELFESEFKDILNKHFEYTLFLSQTSGTHSVVLMEKNIDNQKISGYIGNYENIETDISCGPIYWIGIASNLELPQINFNPIFKGENIVENQLNQIHKAYQNSLTYKTGKAVLFPFNLIKKWLSNQK